MDEFTEEEIEEAEAEDRCLIGEDEECVIHHSYENTPGHCLWSAQHPELSS